MNKELKTSFGNINKLPAGLKMLKELKKYKKVINFGAGLGYKKHQEILGNALELINFDPFIPEIAETPNKDTGAEAVICNNVLNIIEDNFVYEAILDHLEWYGLPVYVTVYEGDKTGIGRRTKTGTYQRNKKARDYKLEERGYKYTKGMWIKE